MSLWLNYGLGRAAFAYPARSSIDNKIKTQRATSDAIEREPRGRQWTQAEMQTRQGRRVWGWDWETCSLLLAVVDLMLRQLPACPALPTFPASSSFSVPSLSSSLAPPVFPASPDHPASLALPAHTSPTPLRFPMFPLHLLLPCCLCLPYSLCFQCSLNFSTPPCFLESSLLTLLCTSPTPPVFYYTIPRLLSSPVMRVLSSAAK